jgi:hypothetical protein
MLHMLPTCRRHVFLTRHNRQIGADTSFVGDICGGSHQSQWRVTCRERLSVAPLGIVLTAHERAATTTLSRTPRQWDFPPGNVSLGRSSTGTSYPGPPPTSPRSYHPRDVYGWLLCVNPLPFACVVTFFVYPIIFSHTKTS